MAHANILQINKYIQNKRRGTYEWKQLHKYKSMLKNKYQPNESEYIKVNEGAASDNMNNLWK